VDDYYFRLVVDEALDNALNHGNIKDPDKSIILKLEFFDEYINITVWDEGKGFTPESIDNPCDEKNRFKRRGRGIHIIKAMGITHWEEKGRCISIRLNGDS
jgi:anti-sigma regulatory factor (Ser/Thr protein kinase)